MWTPTIQASGSTKASFSLRLITRKEEAGMPRPNHHTKLHPWCWDLAYLRTQRVLSLLWLLVLRDQTCLYWAWHTYQSVYWVNSLRPHGLQPARLPCPSPSPGAYSNSCPWSQWCHPTVSSSVVPLWSCLQSFPASGSLMSQLFVSGGQSVGASVSAPEHACILLIPTRSQPLGGANCKEPACQCRRPKRRRFDPWVGKSPWRREWLPTPVFLPGESHGQRSLAGCSP